MIIYRPIRRSTGAPWLAQLSNDQASLLCSLHTYIVAQTHPEPSWGTCGHRKDMIPTKQILPCDQL